ncbi:rhodanese-like domain-containing protein [Caldiplasma sukawensis]
MVNFSRDNYSEIVDCRPLSDYMNGHIRGSVFAPFNDHGSWYNEIISFLKPKKGKICIIVKNDNDGEKILKNIGTIGSRIDVFKYSDMDNKGEEVKFGMISPNEFMNRQDEFTVIDVREPYEWSSGTIDGALLIPLEELISVKHDELEKNKKYAVVCEHGNRSFYATIVLSDLGFNVTNIEGGMNALRQLGIV